MLAYLFASFSSAYHGWSRAQVQLKGRWQCTEVSPKHGVLNDFLIRDHMMVQCLQRPDAVHYMMAVVLLEIEWSVKQCYYGKHWSSRQTLKSLKFSQGVVMEMKSTQFSKSRPEWMTRYGGKLSHRSPQVSCYIHHHHGKNCIKK